MLRILRAFAWMRWRVFVNSLEKTGSRDALHRVAIAIERLAPIMVALVMIPSAIVLAGLAGFAGYQLVSATGRINPFEAIRALLIIATGFCIVTPVAMPGADRTNPVRLLLLPIPARTLYVAQAAGTVGDPWIILLFPVVLALPIGAAIAGAWGPALVALIAGIALVVTLIGISAFMTTVVHLVLRDRRRGELVALAFILVLPLMSLLPALAGSAERRERRERLNAPAMQQEPTEARRSRPLTPVVSAGRRAFAISPSELYATTVRAAVRSGAGQAVRPLGLLLAAGVLIHGMGLVLFHRVLSSPGTTGPRRVASMQGVWARTLPGVSPGTSAVALTLLRLVLRTPRGRSILIAPVLMLVFFGVVMRFGALDMAVVQMAGGLGLATFGSGITLLSITPISLNQFAVDRAGLTMTLLSPLSTRQILLGKALGGALVAIPSALLSVLIAAVVFPGGPPAIWLALAISLVAVYVLTAPVAAVLSAVFARKVDMNSIGRGSNAHGFASLLGAVASALAALPCLGLVLLAAVGLDRPFLAPLLVLIWCAAACWMARALFGPAGRVFDRRRESLALMM